MVVFPSVLAVGGVSGASDDFCYTERERQGWVVIESGHLW